MARSRYTFGDGDAERLGVSKTLVFLTTEEFMGKKTDEAIVHRFNELLVNKYGCDFTVVFKTGDIISGFRDDGYLYNYFLEDIRSLGQQADIITACSPAKYINLADEGYFVGLKEYLTGTEDGNKFYEAYSKKIWDTVEKDGEIYGYSAFVTPTYRYSLVCNKALKEQLNLDTEGICTLYDVGRALSELGEEQLAKLDGIEMLYCDHAALIAMLDYCELGYGIYGKKDAGGKVRAIYPAADEEFVSLCKAVREYKEKGWLRMVYGSPVSITDSVATGNFLFWCGSVMDAEIVGDKIELSGAQYWHKIHDVDVLNTWYGYYPKRNNFVYGISSWSEYTEEAKKLLMLINTETELANLLAYGIEEVNYAYKDKKIIYITEERGINGIATFVNPGITHPLYLEPENKVEFYKELCENYEYNPGWSLDRSEYMDKLEVIDEITNEYFKNLILGNYEDIDAVIGEMNRRAQEAGIDEVIAEFNRQLEELR